jgi:hypothetical protein
MIMKQRKGFLGSVFLVLERRFDEIDPLIVWYLRRSNRAFMGCLILLFLAAVPLMLLILLYGVQELSFSKFLGCIGFFILSMEVVSSILLLSLNEYSNTANHDDMFRIHNSDFEKHYNCRLVIIIFPQIVLWLVSLLLILPLAVFSFSIFLNFLYLTAIPPLVMISLSSSCFTNVEHELNVRSFFFLLPSYFATLMQFTALGWLLITTLIILFVSAIGITAQQSGILVSNSYEWFSIDKIILSQLLLVISGVVGHCRNLFRFAYYRRYFSYWLFVDCIVFSLSYLAILAIVAFMFRQHF